MTKDKFNESLPKKVGVIERIRNSIRRKLGYREGKRFIIDTKPKIREYSEIKLMKIATIEEKLKKALEVNRSASSTLFGIEEQEAISLLEWIVQNARAQFVNSKNEDILDKSLQGFCGLGQGITANTLKNMQLLPYIVNASPTLAEDTFLHAYVAVDIPIQQNGVVQNKCYLIDTTVRQFFLRTETVNTYEDYIKDKKFGDKVASIPGYWMLKMKNGEQLATKLLSDGFAELSEENAKIYGDAFRLADRKRERSTKVPTKKELYTNVSGKEYIERIKRPDMQMDIEKEFASRKIKTKTPLMMKNEIINNKGINFDIEQKQQQTQQER